MNWKALDVSGRGILKDLSQNLPGGTEEEEQENPQSEYLVSQL